MRIFLFVFIMSAPAIAQVDPGNGADGPCDETTITTGAAEYNCTVLNIGPGTHVFPRNTPTTPPDPGIPPVRIKVQGNVTISSGAVLDLSGGNGSPATGATDGGLGSAGASNGADNGAGGPNDAPDLPNGGAQGTSDPAGPCGAGGGGGGFITDGDDGADCSVGIQGGDAGDAYTLLATVFRGGFGGGAAGSTANALPVTSATGGGGGGAIWISAGGSITINGNINVTGGIGGSAPPLSNAGGGGGGSGGAIRIQALGQVVNNGTFFFSGGNGGSGDGGGRSGGRGSDGTYEFEDADNVIQGVGTGAVGAGGGSSEETFRSSISCGTIRFKDEHLLYQMITGFLLMLGLSRILGRFRRSV